MITWLLAVLHLLALVIGLPAIRNRSRALRGTLDAEGLKRVFAADTGWGLAAALWISTGLLRAFGPWEKGAAYYMHNHLFFTKMGFLGLILLLELMPMIALIGWRIRQKKGEGIDTRRARTFAVIGDIQLLLVIGMVVCAVGMARGHGLVASATP